MISVNLTRSWIRTGAICGLLAIVAYLVSSVLPTFLPRIIDYYLFFAIGVLGIVFVAGLYKLLSHHSRESVPLQMGALFGIIAGVLQNAMAVVQATTSIFISRYIREAPDEVTKETLKLIWKGVNLVQLGLDVSWDIFLLIGLILIGVAMLHHPRFGKAFGWTGIFLA
ncbi:MAG: hypothetical protein N3E42_04300, partial [Candidatus Bipolaricaulota bacterium]|nr:hypothetical protein [Candidatus Bipolaricaulota bacterium]